MCCDVVKSDRSDRKIERWSFYDVRLTMQRERYLLVMKGKGHKKGCNKDS